MSPVHLKTKKSYIWFIQIFYSIEQTVEQYNRVEQYRIEPLKTGELLYSTLYSMEQNRISWMLQENRRHYVLRCLLVLYTTLLLYSLSNRMEQNQLGKHSTLCSPVFWITQIYGKNTLKTGESNLLLSPVLRSLSGSPVFSVFLNAIGEASRSQKWVFAEQIDHTQGDVLVDTSQSN